MPDTIYNKTCGNCKYKSESVGLDHSICTKITHYDTALIAYTDDYEGYNSALHVSNDFGCNLFVFKGVESKQPCPSDCSHYDPNAVEVVCEDCNKFFKKEEMLHLSPYKYYCKKCSKVDFKVGA